jgi:hypothetical protein
METKNKYQSPLIEMILLDKDISLQLTSDINPLGEPGDWVTSAQNPFSEDVLEL